MSWHICEVCFVQMDQHEACSCDDCEAQLPAVLFPAPCCPDCPCGSFELMHREVA